MTIKKLKTIVKHIIRATNGFLKRERFTSRKYKIDRYTIKNKNVFFGYYDLNPLNKNGKILACSIDKKYSFTNPDMEAWLDIGYFNIDDKSNFIRIGKTNLWSWQQGCRLQWYNEETVVYNKIIKKKPCAIIQDITSKKEKKILGMPIYDIDENNNFALSLNFFRLQILRPGYGYYSDKKIQDLEKIPKDDGIWHIDIEKGKRSLLVSYSNIISNFPIIIQDDRLYHYLNHIKINPTGNKFLFFYITNNTLSNKRSTYLIVYDLIKKKLIMLERDGNVSHYAWRNDNEILCTVGFSGKGIRYTLYSADGLDKKTIRSNILINDGHPSFFNDKCRFITDTYPNICGMQNLFIADLNGNLYKKIGSFYESPKHKNEFRCDLHPHIINDKYVIFDSTHRDNLRSIYLTTLSE